MEEKKGVTIYSDGTISCSELEFGQVMTEALENMRLRVLIAAATETFLFKKDPVAWLLRDPKNNMEILKKTMHMAANTEE